MMHHRIVKKKVKYVRNLLIVSSKKYTFFEEKSCYFFIFL